MNFDVTGNLDAVARSVSYLEKNARPASAVTLSRNYETTIRDLWEAISNLNRIPLWFAPVSGTPELGGHYSIEGNASGTITECERLSHFALTWEFAGDTSWVAARVSEEGNKARLTLSHTAHLSTHWEEYGAGAVGVGWEMGFLGLALHIADPEWPKPDDLEFATSSDGRAFITGSSEGWVQAAIEAGEEPEKARGAGRRTSAFYMGVSMDGSTDANH